jgi:hypothetical protein
VLPQYSVRLVVLFSVWNEHKDGPRFSFDFFSILFPLSNVLCYGQHSFKLVVVHYLLKDWREKTWRNRPDATGKRTKPITRAQLITEGVLSSKYLCVCVSTTSSVSASFTRVLTSSVISLKKRKGWKKDWKPVLHLSVWHRGARFIKWRVSGLFKLVGTCVVSAHTHTHTPPAI